MENSSKLKTIEQHIRSIKIKILDIIDRTEKLRDFNNKVEMLLLAYETYSENIDVELVQSSSTGKNEKKGSVQSHKTRQSKSCPSDEPQEKLVKKAKKMLPAHRIQELFKSSKNNKNIAMEIYGLLESGNTVPLDDIVKRIKQSKYKVIEILNTLLKERIVVKSFDKGFMYRTNNNI
ncbi:hypothetical protein ENBRE01_0120 [Enteropsectra breve]|nr:hypothetical protein ENBRE01_0120 [Enteropsectra breve]